MSPFIHLKDAFPAGFTSILLLQVGVTKEVFNSKTFYKTPYEDPYKQGIVAGYVYVAELDAEGGVYQKMSDVTEVQVGDPSDNTLVPCKLVEWYRNPTT